MPTILTMKRAMKVPYIHGTELLMHCRMHRIDDYNLCMYYVFEDIEEGITTEVEDHTQSHSATAEKVRMGLPTGQPTYLHS